MSGKHAELTCLKSRKRLLIAESELNRAQFAGDLSALHKGFQSVSIVAPIYIGDFFCVIAAHTSLGRPVGWRGR